MAIILLILVPTDSLVRFPCHPHPNLRLVQDENRGIAIELGSDAFGVRVRNRPSIPFELRSIASRMGRRVLESRLL